MEFIIPVLAGLLAGFVGALGLGGGAVLVMFLTVFINMPQLKAQGINLMFFIPIGLFAIAFHHKKSLIDWKTALPAILCGLVGAAIGCLAARFFGQNITRRIFGVMLLILGARELFMPHSGNKEEAGDRKR